MNMMKNTILIEDTIRTQIRIKMIVKIQKEEKVKVPDRKMFWYARKKSFVTRWRCSRHFHRKVSFNKILITMNTAKSAANYSL